MTRHTLAPVAFAALVALLCALVMCVFARARRVLRRYVLLVLPAVVLGFAPAVAVAPAPYYADGYVGALLLVLLLAMGYGLSIIPARGGVMSELFAVRPSWKALSRRGRSAVAATVAIGALLLFSVVVAPAMRARADAWAAEPTTATVP